MAGAWARAREDRCGADEGVLQEVGILEAHLAFHRARLDHGERIENVRTKFKSSSDALAGGHYDGINIMCRDACSDCLGGLMVALKRMEEDGSLDLLRDTFSCVNLSLGHNDDFAKRNGGDEKWVCIGRCQRANRDGRTYIPGCPQPGFVIRDMLRNIVGLESIYGSEEFVLQEEHIVRLEQQEQCGRTEHE